MQSVCGISLLVADLKADFRNRLSDALRTGGAEAVVETGDSASTITVMLSGIVDVALVDWSLASRDDFSMIRDSHPGGRLSGTGLVVLSDQLGHEERLLAARAGISSILEKPFKADELATQIRNALKKAEHNRRKDEERKSRFEDASARSQADDLYRVAGEKLARKKYAEAEALLQMAVSGCPNFPQGWKGLSLAKRGLGDIDGSHECLARAATEYAWLGRDEDARECYSKARKALPGIDNPFLAASRRFRRTGDLQRAADLCEKAAESSARDPEISLELAELYINLDRNEAALSLIKPVLRSGDNSRAADLYEKITGLPWLEPAPEQKSAPRKTGPKERRRAKRYLALDMAVSFGFPHGRHPVNDISLVGISFLPESREFSAGEVLTFSLTDMQGVRCKGVKALVRRISPEAVGCEFDTENMPEKTLEKLRSVLPDIKGPERP